MVHTHTFRRWRGKGLPGDPSQNTHVSTEEGESRTADSGSSSNNVNTRITCWNFSSSERSVYHLETFFAGMIVLIGISLAIIFLLVGIDNERKKTLLSIENNAIRYTDELNMALSDYVVATAWIHQFSTSGLLNRESFHELYLSIQATGLDFHAAEFVPNVTHVDRGFYEAEAKAYYAANYPHIDYQGFRGFEEGSSEPIPSSNRSFYFPVHYLEPVLENIPAIDFDLYSSNSRKATINTVMQTWEPTITDRLRLVQETEDNSAYGVLIVHPGAKIASLSKPRDLSVLVIRIPSLLERAFSKMDVKGSKIYLFDVSNMKAQFLGGVVSGDNGNLVHLPETEFTEVEDAVDQSGDVWLTTQELDIVGRKWVLVSISEQCVDLTTIIIGTVLIALCCILIASWFLCTLSRAHYITKLKAESKREKIKIQFQNAQEAARAERELNDFIAHEVRNPLSAALSALTFVHSAIVTIDNYEHKATLLEDTKVIEVSLKYINNLLRNTLDLHCSQSGQMKLKPSYTDIRQDILEPVKSMLSPRHKRFEINIHCPSNLFAMVDRLRLEQVVMNLAVNASKFVMTGYINLRAEVVDEKLEISVEDSGPGIPMEKRKCLFLKYQESLDILNQGTGIGLCLCHSLVKLMDGQLWLDESYTTGIPDSPGTRMVVQLNMPRIPPSALASNLETMESAAIETTSKLLEEDFKVLFVDDDMVLRKLFSRMVKSAYPQVEVKEAACGEAAIEMAKTEKFDVIFVDQYMASANKTLLGTETVRAMRGCGINSVIVGCSANDVKDSFMGSGADFFVFKPFPQTKSQIDSLFARCIRLLNEKKQ